MQFANVTIKAAELRILWDNAAVGVHFTTDDDAQITANIDKLMQGDKKPYFNAIQYYYENNKDMQKALGWVAEAEKADPKGPWYKLWRSRLLLKSGDKAGAAAAAEEGVKLSKETKDDEYLRLNEEALAKAKS
jgi:phenylpropionate dioxygenase-like ring-hydroxylating dioxygenase large terminal subunit